MENKGSATSFGPFLESLQKQRGAQESAASEARRKVLASLLDSGPESVEELRQRVRIRLEDFADAVKGLREAELIEIEPGDTDEIVELTERGRSFAELDW